jgi:hypothetical protein
MNAVERFLAASRAHDLDAVIATLADEVVMRNPATDDPVIGPAAVGEALRAVDGAADAFRHTHLLRSSPGDESQLYGLVYEAQVGELTLSGVDLVTIDAHDRIATFTVLARPIAALMALGGRMSAQG